MSTTKGDSIDIARMGENLAKIATNLSGVCSVTKGSANAPTTFGQVIGEDKRIAQTSQELLTEFHDIAIQYRDAVVKGREFSESGAKVAEEYVDRMAAQNNSESELEELTKHLPSRLDSLLKETKDMSKKLNTVSRSLERLEQEQEKEYRRIQISCSKTKKVMKASRGMAIGSAVLAGACALGGLIAPPLLVPAAALAVNAGIGSVIASDSKKSMAFKTNSLDLPNDFMVILMGIKAIIAVHIKYWSEVLQNLEKISAISEGWLKKPSAGSLAMQLSANWKEATNSYKLCNKAAIDTSQAMTIYLDIRG